MRIRERIAKMNGVEREFVYLFSVGQEPYEVLMRRFEAAFESLDQGIRKSGMKAKNARRC